MLNEVGEHGTAQAGESGVRRHGEQDAYRNLQEPREPVRPPMTASRVLCVAECVTHVGATMVRIHGSVKDFALDKRRGERRGSE